jgi:wyosine [tRNA(Phe)-imidazoG37] synthetase (radical SAM superfamily)
VSIGINLTPNKTCNFNCVYCQVDRTERESHGPVDLSRIERELQLVVRAVEDEMLFRDPVFRKVPVPLRKLRNITVSGDGEPTLSPHLHDTLELVFELRARRRLPDVPVILMTNASRLRDASVTNSIEFMGRNHGEVWAKLDAGTDSYFAIVNRSRLTLAHIQENILVAARMCPVVIQSLFARICGTPPHDHEVSAFCERLRAIAAGGGQIRQVQVCTLARAPAEPSVTPLSRDELERIRAFVANATGIPARSFGIPQ